MAPGCPLCRPRTCAATPTRHTPSRSRPRTYVLVSAARERHRRRRRRRRYMIVSEARRIGTRFRLEPDEGVSFGDLKSIFPRLAGGASGKPKPFSDDPEDFPLLTTTVKDTKA